MRIGKITATICVAALMLVSACRHHRQSRSVLSCDDASGGSADKGAKDETGAFDSVRGAARDMRRR